MPMNIINLRAGGSMLAALGVFCFTACYFSPRAAALAIAQGTLPAPGDIAISEIMFNPASPADDNDGEYFEVTNTSGKILDLNLLYVQDLATPGSTTAPYFHIPAGALAPLYPGEAFVFARTGDTALNGAIPSVHYVYSVPVGASVPADKSKVSHTGMALSNSSIDLIAITTDAPYALGGNVVEMVTYDPTKAPFITNNGTGFERSNLLGPWSASNVAASAAPFGSIPQLGTPGARNSNDSTLYPCYYKYSAVLPGAADTGSLLAAGPASVKGAAATLLLSGGAPSEMFAFALSPAPAETQLFDGTLLVDLNGAYFWAIDTFVFDGDGKAALSVPVPAELLGGQIYLQWICYDSNNVRFVFSNGLGVDVTP